MDKFELRLDEDENIYFEMHGNAYYIIDMLVSVMEENEVAAGVVLGASEVYKKSYDERNK